MFWKTEEIEDDCSASTLRERIKGYFSSRWGSDITVVKVDYDDMDVETTDSALVVKSVYTVTLLKRINGPSFASAAILQDVVAATITIDVPFQNSSPPLSGSFIITCPDEQGNSLPTHEFDYTEWT